MFWKDPKGLRDLPNSSRIGISAFLIIAGIGYLLGFFNILLTYQDVDQKPGLGIEDIQISFYGAREQTALEISIDGSMKTYFASDRDYESVKNWITEGGKEADYPTIENIIATSCATCHSSAAQVADVVTESYDDISSYLVQDTGKSVSRLISLSHTHVTGTLTLIFGLVLVFSYTRFSELIKTLVYTLGFGAIVLDIGAWWLAKIWKGAAFLVILGGAALGVAFAVLVLLSLYDAWLRKAEVKD
ncbi:MAG: hypothetical protein HN368_03545, partial [Spirochaetales bacterium]|nr:hypothetical protein [Spirochaetales bacterium]